MSYYYEDASSYCYSVPTHYEDTSHYSYSVPIHYDETPPALDPSYYVDTPQYDDDAHHPHSLYYDDMSFNEEAEVITYFEDEVDPSYRNYSVDNNNEDNYLQDDPYPTPTVEYYDVEEVHPIYCDFPTNGNHAHLADTEGPLDNQTESVHPPAVDLMFDNLSNDGLAQVAQQLEDIQRELLEWDAEDVVVNNLDEVEHRKPRHHEIAQFIFQVETIRRQRMEHDEEEDIFKDGNDVGEDDDDHSCSPDLPTQSQPILPHHHTPIPQLRIVKHRKLRYYLGPHVRRRRSPKLRSNIRTTPPPDIRPPKPFPPSPNIHT
jgi:hypothetical protein